MERHEKGEARVIPIILRACDWRDAPFAKLQVLPEDGKPVMSWANLDEAYTAVVMGMKRVVLKLLRTRREQLQAMMAADSQKQQAEQWRIL